MSNGWVKQYKIRITIERIESEKGSNKIRKTPSLFMKYVTENSEGKEMFYGPDRAMLLAYGFLFDKLQGFTK